MTTAQLQELVTKAVEAAVDKMETTTRGSTGVSAQSRGRGRRSTSSSAKPQEMGVPDSTDGRVYTGSLKLSVTRCATVQ